MKAIRLYRSGRFREAMDTFICTNEVLPANLTTYWIGRSAQDAGLIQPALDAFRQIREHPPAAVTRQELDRRIFGLVQRLVAARVAAQARRGTKNSKAHKNAAGVGGQRSRRTTMKLAAWVLWGVSAGFLAVSAAVGGVAAYDQRRLEHPSDGTWWDPAMQRRYDRRRALLSVTWTSLGVGVLAAAAGTALYVLGRKPERQITRVMVTPTRRGVMTSMSLQF